jgi:hypothetical protein
LQKLRYEVDPHNRLIVGKAGKRSSLTRFRKVLEGRFKTGRNNILIYHIKAPMYGAESGLKVPHQVKLKGKWSLTENHDLKLTLDKWRRQSLGDELTLQGEILQAQANSLLFAVTTRSKENIPLTYLFRLRGIWQTDKHNRLTFRVKKGRGRYDALVFDGIWEVDKHHRIVYRYEKSQLIRKEKLEKTLIFKGFWDISRRNKVSYKLSMDGKSIFVFQTDISFLTDNYIRYKIGIAISDKKWPVRRVLTLFGEWKIKRDVGLLFEIEYEQGRTGAIVFGAEIKLTKREKFEFKLKNSLGQNLGLKLKLTRERLKGDSQTFLKMFKSKKECSIYMGRAWRW